MGTTSDLMRAFYCRPDAEVRAQVNGFFEVLNSKLRVKPLRTEKGSHRIAHAAEFMFMHIDAAGCVGFKHSHTRNYVFLIPDPDGKSYELYVPSDNKPFMLGTFDYPEVDRRREEGK